MGRQARQAANEGGAGGAYGGTVDAMTGCTDLANCHTRETDWQAQMDQMFSDTHGMSTSWPDDCGW